MGVFISNSYSSIEASHLRDENKRLATENQTLRQLAIAFADCRNTDCSNCIRYDYEWNECTLDKVMRDLGIEVDG